jgi:type I restriction enzyme S subunit
MSEWKTYKLGELINVKHGFAFKGEFFSDEPTNDILLTPGNFKIGGGFKTDKLKYYKGDYPSDYILKEGDILITMTDLSKAGDTLGYSAKIPEHSGIRYLHNQRLGLVQFKNDDIDPGFLYWVLRTKPYQYYIVGSATGSTVKHTSPTRICTYEFQAPKDKAEQKQIAQILSSLDDKIELNLQMNQTLEAMAQAIFKEWFVNFNFPGFDGELVDGLPKGWSQEPIDERIEFLNGLPLQKFPPLNEFDFLPVIKIRELKQGFSKASDKASTELPEKYVIYDGDILFSWSGSLEVVLWCEGKGALNQHLFKVSSNVYPKWFYFFWVREYLPLYKSIAEGKATTMGHIQRRHLTDTIINVPNYEIMSLADNVLSPLLDRIQENKIQIQTLTQTRDTLLPKLMSGQLEVV